MNFSEWFAAAWDAEHRAGYHEGGHVEYARHVTPAVPFSVSVDGAGGGLTQLDLGGFTVAQRYGVAVAGCLAEAKGMGNNGVIGPGSLDDVAQQIFDGFVPGDHAWQIDIPIAGVPVPASTNGADFAFLGAAPPDLDMLKAAVAEVAGAFNDDATWLRVRRRAWSLAMVKRPVV